MPKYINKTDKPIYLVRDNTIIEPSKIKTTRAFYDDIPGLELIDIEPYVSPYILTETKVLKKKDDTESYNVFNAIEITIVSLDQNLKVLLHTDQEKNDNVILLLPGMKLHLNNRHKLLRTIYIKNPNNFVTSYYIALKNKYIDYFSV